jgi:putative NADPH-quinone reductase
MKILLVYCHPDPDSFASALLKAAERGLKNHELRSIDLYGTGFDPVLSGNEWRSYMTATGENIAGVAEHVDDLRWADGLLFIYPTWFYGPPAILKGWIERVWLPGVAFSIDTDPNKPVKAGLTNIKYCGVITTSGSPRWWLWWVRDPGKNLIKRGLRPLFNKRCKMAWWQLYRMDHSSLSDRKKFLRDVERDLTRFGS